MNPSSENSRSSEYDDTDNHDYDGGRALFLSRQAMLDAADPEDRHLIQLAFRGDIHRLTAKIESVGACEHPVMLRGQSLVVAVASGAILSEFSSDDMPDGTYAVRCMNPRASRCAPCSRLYKADAYQLVKAGLVGGKGIPPEVAGHPFVFATLTAPSFGLVHRKPDPRKAGDRCRPRRDLPQCRHGRPQYCTARHDPTDKIVGSPFCADCYDYEGSVLWNAHARMLWSRFVDMVYHRLARAGGITRPRIRDVVRVERVRFREYQARGLVHFHAIIRLDGPEDLEAPPSWATAEVLADAVRSAVPAVSVTAKPARRVLRFGAQTDARPILAEDAPDGGSSLSWAKVAGYVVKYVTKGIEDAHGSDWPIRHRSQIDAVARTGHVRAQMHACWRLGLTKGFEHLRLCEWAHMLGFGGHLMAKSHRFSVTIGELRQVRIDHNRAEAGQDFAGQETVTKSQWRYVGRGWDDPVVERHAADIRADAEDERQRAKDAADLERQRRAA